MESTRADLELRPSARTPGSEESTIDLRVGEDSSAVRCRRSLTPGRRVDDYELVRQIGRGGMGLVWEARQLSLQRPVAIKFLDPIHRLSERALQRFEQEALAGGRVTHPGVVAVHAIGEFEGTPYIVQELVGHGRSLDDVLSELRRGRKIGALHSRWVARFFAAAAEAIATEHAAGVVHRDVKPGNLLVTEDGAPKVADFGLASIEGVTSVSAPDEIAGTAYYMSPEQADPRGLPVDPRSDVFSLGCALYEALTLQRPFDGDTIRQVVDKVLHLDPPDPRRLRSRIPRDLAVVTMKALEKHPDQRYADMQAMAADLRRFLAHEPIRARPAFPLQRVLRTCQRHVALASAAAVVMGALVVLTGLLLIYLAEQRRARRAFELLPRIVALLNVDTWGADLDEYKLLREAVGFAREELHDQDLARAALFSAVGGVYAARARWADAAPLLREALACGNTSSDPDAAPELLHLLVRCHVELGEFDAAEELARGRLRAGAGSDDELVRKELLAEILAVLVAEGDVARIEAFEREHRDSTALLVATMEGHERRHGEHSARALELRLALGRHQLLRGRIDDAVATLETARARLMSLAPGDPLGVHVHRALYESYRRAGRAHDAWRTQVVVRERARLAFGADGELTWRAGLELGWAALAASDFREAHTHFAEAELRARDELQTLRARRGLARAEAGPLLLRRARDDASVDPDLERCFEAFVELEQQAAALGAAGSSLHAALEYDVAWLAPFVGRASAGVARLEVLALEELARDDGEPPDALDVLELLPVARRLAGDLRGACRSQLQLIERLSLEPCVPVGRLLAARQRLALLHEGAGEPDFAARVRAGTDALLARLALDEAASTGVREAAERARREERLCLARIESDAGRAEQAFEHARALRRDLPAEWTAERQEVEYLCRSIAASL